MLSRAPQLPRIGGGQGKQQVGKQEKNQKQLENCFREYSYLC